MKSKNSVAGIAAIVAVFGCLSCGYMATAQSHSVIKHFGVVTNVSGWYPNAALVQAPDGTLYGTTTNGESSVAGTVFKINGDGTGFTVLKWFTNSTEGAFPHGTLVLSDDTLYGTTYQGGSSGYGTVFRVSTNGTGFTVLKNFAGSDGKNPTARLTLDGSTLYGTTFYGGNAGNGAIFKVNTDGSGYTVLKHLLASIGNVSYPYAGLTLDGSTLYGAARQGGSSSRGAVFKINTDGTGFTVLKSFTGIGTDGEAPYADLTLDGSTLYGTTYVGGSSDFGTVFKMETDGTGFTTLRSFTGSSDGRFPIAGLTLSGGTLYGTTEGVGVGTVFKINTDGSGYAVIKNFNTSNDGRSPYAGLTLSGSTLYGTTRVGGSTGYGTVFKVDTNGTGYAVLKHFHYSGNAGNPYAGLALSGSTLYGTTYQGGISNLGTVFKVETDGSGYTVLKDFVGTDGKYPEAGVALSGSTLFGTTTDGGVGSVFKIDTDGSGYTVIKNFITISDGRVPRAEVTLSGSTLYGTTYSGGSSNLGTVFKVETNGSGFTVIKNFTGSDGEHPRGKLTLSGSTLYGTTEDGGSFNYGTIFKVDTDGSGYTVLKHCTTSDGRSPFAGLTLSGSTLYGTTREAGFSSAGTVFKVETDGSGYTVLTNYIGAIQAGLTLSGSKLFGATYYGGSSSAGTVFQVNTDGSGYAVLKHFIGSDGKYPAGLVLSGSKLYGTTADGGSLNEGTVFSFDLSPVIVVPPSDQTALLGGNALFALTVSGEVPLSYQWQLNGTNIDGATNSTLPLASLGYTNQGNYRAIVTNLLGSTTSSVAVLTVTASCPAVAISLATLPDGTLAMTYNQSVTASGGAGTYTYAVTSGSLPLGLAFAATGLLSGSPLAIGTNTFTVTATDANGCTGNQNCTVVITGSGVPDAVAPTVKITAPSNNLILTNAAAALLGTAKDNTSGGGVALVLLSVNGGEWQLAQTVNQFTNWTFNATLVAGRTKVIAQALDYRGNLAAVTNTYFFSVPTNLIVNIIGSGSTVAMASSFGTPTNGATLIVNRPYTLTATAGTNCLFSNWLASVDGGPVTVATNTAKYTFLMQTNLALTAQFVTNRFLTATGSYNGLFWDTNNGVAYASAGVANVKVTAKQGTLATFSASLSFAGEKRSSSGTFDLAGNGVGKKPFFLKVDTNTFYQLYLHLPPTGPLTGVLSNQNGSWSAVLSADKQTPSSAYAGQYTLVLPGSLDPAEAPQGDGYGLVTVNTNGMVMLAGALGDGTAISQKVPASADGDWPLFASVYPTTNNNVKVKGGVLLGWLSLTNDLDGTLYHIKTAVPGLMYPSGFTNEFAPLASTYTNLALSTNRIIELTSGSNGLVTLSGGGLPVNLTNLISLSVLNKFTAPVTNTAGVTNKLTLTLAPKTGKLTGSFKTNGVTATALTGVVLQEANTGHGYFKGATNSGSLLLQGQ